MQKFLVPALVAVGLLVGHAVFQGIWTQRWHTRSVNESQEAFAARLKFVPVEFGEWKSIDAPIDKRQLEASGAVGTFSRRFQNQTDPSKIVEIFLVCGHPGDMTQHTPEQCYPLNGNAELDEQSRYPVDTGRTMAEFWTNRFRKSSSIEASQQVRVFWSFTNDGKWLAPSVPKFELLDVPALYKIYAITESRAEGRNHAEESAAVGFLREFIPLMNAALFPPETPSPAPADASATAANAAAPGAAELPVR